MVDIDQLPKNVANYTALTPLWFLERAATMHPTRNSLIQGSRRYTWQQTYHRRRRCASAHANNSIGQGKIIAVIAPNILALYEAHFGIPGAVLNPFNIRLNASTVAFLLGHCSAATVIVDQESFSLAEEALKIWSEKAKTFSPPLLVVVDDEHCDPKSLRYAVGEGAIEYEDEWQSIVLGYTSSTTASPKGVELHHRGAYLMSLSGALIWGMTEGNSEGSIPSLHCIMLPCPSTLHRHERVALAACHHLVFPSPSAPPRRRRERCQEPRLINLPCRQASSPQDEPYRRRSNPPSVTLVIETPLVVTKSHQRHKHPEQPPHPPAVTTILALTASHQPSPRLRHCESLPRPTRPPPFSFFLLLPTSFAAIHSVANGPAVSMQSRFYHEPRKRR